jgi:two-component system, OmpR family, phosphate regulon sensor histidine kinase PhoR
VRKIVIVGMILAVFLALGLGWIVSAQTIQPIERMIQVSRRFAEGDFSRTIPQDSRDEIGELTVTLNKMAKDLESKIHEIKTQNQHLEAIFSSMIEGVIVVNGSGQVISINSAVEKIFAITHRRGEKRPLLEIIRNNDIFEIMNKALIKGEVFSKDVSLSYPVKRIFRINASPVFEKGIVSGCLVVIHDITEIRRLETMRRDFVANVSHELKTPLTSIKGYVETLLDGALEDKEHSRQFLTIVSEHAERLGQLINDLLDLSTIESQEVALNVSTFDLKGLVQKVLFNFKTQIGRQGLEIVDDLSKDLMITADRARMEQVLTNLIDNAIKFNKSGGFIKFSGRKSENKIEIVVEDSGIGIPANDVPRIFERFYRVDKARSRELGGTGLGLSIVKHIIELHHGTVGVESTEGFGSKFWFSFPV